MGGNKLLQKAMSSSYHMEQIIFIEASSTNNIYTTLKLLLLEVGKSFLS